MRPVQWKAIRRHLQSHENNVVASILAGDCNANQPRDRTEPQENGFKDAYLELGGREGSEEGATWGFQSADGNRWGKQRLDKIVYWGDIIAKSLERIGVNIVVDDEHVARELEGEGELSFVTDHYGLIGKLIIGEAQSQEPAEKTPLISNCR